MCDCSNIRVTRLTTTGSDQTINLGTTKLHGIFMEGAANLVVKDGGNTITSLTAFANSVDYKGARLNTSLIVNISANSCFIIWEA